MLEIVSKLECVPLRPTPLFPSSVELPHFSLIFSSYPYLFLVSFPQATQLLTTTFSDDFKHQTTTILVSKHGTSAETLDSNLKSENHASQTRENSSEFIAFPTKRPKLAVTFKPFSSHLRPSFGLDLEMEDLLLMIIFINSFMEQQRFDEVQGLLGRCICPKMSAFKYFLH
ncbi:hypothetical protein DVH24_038522 [Malus domestica]|uniref:Uncharacterized protein n=1 Tax=Malus domestica TaxID=3750 RepID=A0A498K9X2_MALDO|nr:hypothetical protein DVH24_038522 [Malus domestica]